MRDAGTPQFVACNQSIGQPAAVVSAMSADCEKLIAAANQDCLFATDGSLNHAAIRDLVHRNTTAEIGRGWNAHIFIILCAHLSPIKIGFRGG